MTRDAEEYRALLRDVSELYETLVLPLTEADGIRRRTAYWHIGRRIIEVAQHGSVKADYGGEVIRQLAADLHRRWPGSPAVRTLFDIRRLAAAYEEAQLHPQLGWSHYRALIRVRDRAVRERLARQAVAEGLSADALLVRVRRANGFEAAAGGDSLVPREGRHFLYKLVIRDRAGAGTRECFLDCGFHVRHRIAARYAVGMAEGQLVRSVPAGDGGFRLELSSAPPSERYCYRATVLRIIDGDTLLADVDLGFSAGIEMRFRLRGVDAPELDTADGKRAHRFVCDRIAPFAPVVLCTYGCDVYGRYLADVFYSRGKSRRHPTMHSGVFLNAELIEAGVAGLLRWVGWD